MRLHSDTLIRADFTCALKSAGLDDVWIDECSLHGSRKRLRAFEIRLAAKPGRDKEGTARRPRMNNPYGAENSVYQKAATYKEHGWWMAELYKIDPELIVAGCYDNISSFNSRTENMFIG